MVGIGINKLFYHAVGITLSTILADAAWDAFHSEAEDDPTKPKLPGLGGTWEEELYYADTGPKDEYYNCQNGDDEFCKEKLKRLSTIFMLIRAKEAIGMATFSEKLVFNMEVDIYNTDCPYWIKLDKFKY